MGQSETADHRQGSHKAPRELDIGQSLLDRMTYTVGKDHHTATDRDWFHAVAYAVRDRLVERWMHTMRNYYRQDSKRIYYLSLEFLIGRSLRNSLLNLGLLEETELALDELGLDLAQLEELEFDAALGNGGLGRLAACLLDSMATLGLPGYGYGIRYEYGIFRQKIEDGHQVEQPDNWLRYTNPWEFPRPELLYQVKFHGRVVQYPMDDGTVRYHWIDSDDVMALAYDTPIPGYGGKTVNNIRLWSAKASRDFELQYFNEGDYIKSVEQKNRSENLSKVLYPDDRTASGKELRLKQQYFFVCASLQDILYRFLKQHMELDLLPEKVVIQLNDTHPAIAIPELMRVLVDINHLQWQRAWEITTRTFAYTNHTLLPEALESWPVSLFESLLPRHMQIIYEINHRFLKEVMHTHPGNPELLRKVSIIDEEGERSVRMANLAIIGSSRVNGVAQMHTRLLQEQIFPELNALYPDKFVNITNGITPRLWLSQANPQLSGLIASRIGSDFLTHLDALEGLLDYLDDDEFIRELARIKLNNKTHLAESLKGSMGVALRPDTMFDVQIKRIHEYKRQLLNVLHCIVLYNRIRHHQGDGEMTPRTVLFSGKAAPGYAAAKLIIKLVSDVADIINHDPEVQGRLQILFIPNYDVTAATRIIPAADLSEQISTAGTEASGTGNMKLALNGALTIGTLDGANIELQQAVGRDNIFICGNTVEQLDQLRHGGYRPMEFYQQDEELREALDMIGGGYFSPSEPSRFNTLVDDLHNHDHYMLLADFRSYIEAQDRVERLYRDPLSWHRKALVNIAHMGRFSADRTIGEYQHKIWSR